VPPYDAGGTTISADAVSVLFVCTGNAGRSQMAQAMLRRLAGEGALVESAGVQPWNALHPMAIRVMAERGITLDGHSPKPVSAVAGRRFDFVVTIGNPARAQVPGGLSSSAYWMHWHIADPADADGAEESRSAFHAAAAAIERRLPQLLAGTRRLPRPGRFSGEPGINTSIFGPGAFKPTCDLPLVAQAGFSAIELSLEGGRNQCDSFLPSNVRELRAVADDLGLLIWSLHAPPETGSVAATDPNEQRRRADCLRDCRDLAEELGAKAIVSHALVSAPQRQEPSLMRDLMLRFLASLEAEMDASPVTLAFENGLGLASQTPTDRMLEWLEGTSRPAYGIAWDTGHSNIAGNFADIGAHAGDRLVTVHLNDNDGATDTHACPGQGTADWPAIIRQLEQAGYAGVWMYEILGAAAEPRELLSRIATAHRRLAAERLRRP
jgi:sugar phosphate isomerase/epimerase/protein-tyrosine-phosphatase